MPDEWSPVLALIEEHQALEDELASITRERDRLHLSGGTFAERRAYSQRLTALNDRLRQHVRRVAEEQDREL